jgi:hypothetical protein
MDAIERKIRDLEEITSTEKQVTLFSRFLMNSDIQVREGKKPINQAKVVGYDEKLGIARLEIHNSPYMKGARMVAHKFVGRFIQFEGTLEEVQEGNIHLLKIQKTLVAKKTRGSTRITPHKDVVYANNIKITKSSVDLDSLNVPTFVKITFQDYEKRLMQKFDSIKIGVFSPGMEEKFFTVKHTGKTFYVRNTLDHESYVTDNPEEFVDFDEDILEEPKSFMSKYKFEKIVSEVIMPIIYLNSDGDGVAIGYIHIQSKKKFIESEDVMETKILCFEMIDRIRESFTIVYTNKAEIENISMEGLRVKITEPELVTQIPILSGFTMDIVFRMQSPIQVSVHVRNVVKTQQGELLVGLEIDGFRKGDKPRFMDNLRALTRPSKH